MSDRLVWTGLSAMAVLGLVVSCGPPSGDRPELDAAWGDARQDAAAPPDGADGAGQETPPVPPDGGMPPIRHSYDVVVVGAGTGGFAAALEAARHGARVALVEETEWVGGQATAAGVSTMDVPEHWGIYDEFIGRVRAHYAALGKSIGTCYWSATTDCFEPSVGRAIMEQMLAEEQNIDVFYRMRLVGADHPVVDGRPRVVSIVVEERPSGTRHEFSAHVFIDATEYGDLLPLAGARYRVGNSTSDALDTTACVQSITYVAIIRKYATAPPEELVLSTPPPGYDSSVEAAFAAIVAPTGVEWIDSQGQRTDHFHEYPVGWRTFVLYRGMPDSSAPGDYDSHTPDDYSRTGVNWPNDYDVTVAAIEDRQVRRTVECAAKLKTIQFLYYMQNVLSKTQWAVANDEGYDTDYNQEDNDCPNIPPELKPIERFMPIMPYVRESRRVVGLYTLVAGDIKREVLPGGARATKNFPTAIALGLANPDLHHCRDATALEEDLESWDDVPDSRRGGRFQVPFESFIPENVDGLLPAEKNLSVSRLVNGTIRFQPITMLTGQAVGALAALAVHRQEQPRHVPAIRVQDILVREGVQLSLLVFNDVPPDHPSWPAVEIAATRGIMLGDGASLFGPDQEVTRGEAAVVLARLFELDTTNPPSVATFADVPTSSPYFAYVEAIYAAGLTAGCGASPPRYCPDDPETRTMLAIMLVKGVGLDPNTAPTAPLFSDVPPSHVGFRFIQLAASEGLMSGCAPDRFCPDVGVTRADTAETVWNTLLYKEP